MRPGGVLVVEQDLEARDLVAHWLTASGYEVVAAADDAEALWMLEEQTVGVAVCAIRAPGRDGLWLLEQLRRLSPETALVLATQQQDVGSAVASLRLGVVDYLIKPFGRERLREAVRRGSEWHRAAVTGRADRARLREDVDRRRIQLAGALSSVTIDSRSTLEATLGMLTLREPALLEHGRRVASLARAMAARLGFDAPTIEALERAALVHDIPKLVMPESILAKGGPLMPQELDVVRVGPSFGHDLMTGIDYLEDAAAIVRARYEWWDGSGYPRGLEGPSIPPESRVLAVADTFDTLVHPRRYRAAMDEPAALAEIRRCRGTQFEPTAVDVLERVVTGEPAQVGAASRSFV